MIKGKKMTNHNAQNNTGAVAQRRSYILIINHGVLSGVLCKLKMNEE
jgi:hypothetical protein